VVSWLWRTRQMPAKKPKTTSEPETLQECLTHFADAGKAFEFFRDMRWPDGVICPYCEGEEHSFIRTVKVWACKSCKKRFSVKIGTVMEDSPLSLTKWVAAIWLITNAKNGISSWEVHRALGITQKSAWFLLHRIRLALQQGSFDKLGGDGIPVEADETFIGGKARFMHKDVRARKITGTGGAGKAVVMGLLDRKHGSNPSRVRVQVVKNRQRDTLQPEVRVQVEPGAILLTDAHVGYHGLSEDYAHKVIDHAEKYVDGIVHTNGMENFWSLLKRGLNGTYVSVMPFHLFRYLDEQAFRFNERKDNDRGRFLKATAGVSGKRLTYKQLIGKDGPDEATA
jgi:transposase-like protein